MQILLVEDDPDCKNITRSALSSFAEVTAVDTAAAALASFNNGKIYDLLIIDIGLPDKSGKELLQRLRETSDEPKAVFYTGYMTDAFELTCGELRRLNVVDVWIKPISFLGLKQRVEDIIQHGAFAYCKRAA